ncbi:hypothetical protein HPTD01_1344 [Halomonas sp. TD01]|nr:hypothetical protein HPTD01_1344 [Halomonas sp. TD01]
MANFRSVDVINIDEASGEPRSFSHVTLFVFYTNLAPT